MVSLLGSEADLHIESSALEAQGEVPYLVDETWRRFLKTWPCKLIVYLYLTFMKQSHLTMEQCNRNSLVNGFCVIHYVFLQVTQVL